MICWICGGPADSREHRVKASDLRLLFPEISQLQPIYSHNEQRPPKSVGSVRSDTLKWEAKLCHACNTTLTQPYDRAWQTLSTHLFERPNPAPGQRVRLHKIFPGSTRRSMRHVHLFFVKLMGCLIAEHKPPIDIAPFANALRRDEPHPQVYLSFGVLPILRRRRTAMITPFGGFEAHSLTEYAQCKYMIGHVFVELIYSKLPNYILVTRDVWHPADSKKGLGLSRLRNNRQAVRNTTWS